MTTRRRTRAAPERPLDAQQTLRRDYMAGTQPPYYGVLCDEVSLRCLAEGVVPARLRLMAHDLLTGEAALAITKESD